MKHLGYHQKLPASDHAILDQIANRGYLVSVNFTRHGAEYLTTNYPIEWVNLYEERAYMWFDPVLAYAMLRKGSSRWSEIRIPDLAGVFKAGKDFELNHGIVVSRKSARGRCVLSVARHDRELSESEISLLGDWFDIFLATNFPAGPVSAVQVSALALAAKGISVSEAAQLTGCSESAMKTRLKDARIALGAKSNAHAVAIAIKRKLI